MIIPHLKILCAEKASYYMRFANSSLPFTLPVNVSNQLFEANESFFKLDRSKLQLTTIGVGKFEFSEEFEELSTFHLESLRIGSHYYWKLESWFKGEEHKSVIDCLCECLASSRLSLEALIIPIKDMLDKYWLEKLLDYFVNLHHLDILPASLGWWDAEGDDDNYPREFPLLKKVYPGVGFLNISSTFIHRLNGISNFPNLTFLSMRNLDFNTADDIQELFTLRHLKFLDVSHRIVKDIDPWSIIVTQLVQSGSCLPELEELDCSSTIVIEGDLDKLLCLNPTIRKIALYRTQTAKYKKEGVTVISESDLESSVMALERYGVTDENYYNETIIDKILVFLKEELNFEKNERVLRHCLDLLLDSAGDYLYGRLWNMNEESSVFQSVILFSELYLKYLSPKKIRHIISVLIYTPMSYSTYGYGILSVPNILETPGLEIPSLYQKALNFFSGELMEYTEHHFKMVNVLKQLHAKTTRAIRNRATGKERCITFLYTMLHVLGQDEDLNMPLCKLVAKTNKLMISLMESELDVKLAVDLVSRLGDQRHPHMKLFHLNACRFVMYRLKTMDVEELAARVDLKVIMRCFLGNLRKPDSNTGEYLDRKLAYSAMKILVHLYQFLNEDEFIAELRQITENWQYTYFLIPATHFNKDTGEQTFITYSDKTLDEWLNSIETYITRFQGALHTANIKKYRRRRMSTERSSVRSEYLLDPSTDRNYRW